MSAAAAFFLFVLTVNPLPSLSPVAVFHDQASCQKAADAMTAALTGAEEPAKIACVSESSLEALADANNLHK